MKLRLSWLVAFIALTIVVVPVTLYDVTRNSTVCNLGIGVCAGSFTIGTVSLEHEAIGVGFILAAFFLRQSPLRFAIFGIGLVLFLADFPGDWFTNPVGSMVSLALGLGYAFSFSEVFYEDRLGEVEV